jgi:putative methionine-R-sulfoxide reductase with GAF domain
MKNIYRTLSFITMPLFLLSAIAGGYILYKFPEKLATTMGIADMGRIGKIRESMYLTNITYLIVCMLAIITCLMFLFALQKSLLTASQVDALQLENSRKNVLKQDNETDILEKDVVLQRIADIKKLLAEHFSSDSLKWEKLLLQICQTIEASQAAFYVINNAKLVFRAGYAFYLPESKSLEFELGEGLVGQAAKEGKFLIISPVPEGYITVLSGLGHANPGYLALIPVRRNDEIAGMIEIASFKEFSKTDIDYFKSLESVINL